VKRVRLLILASVSGLMATSTLAVHGPGRSAAAATSKPSCGGGAAFCTELDDFQSAFYHYVGHDEPSVLFYDTTPGSGNHMQYQATLPTEPTTTATSFSNSKGFSFELSPAFWFGMAVCDTQSYPEQQHSSCPADSDSNIRIPGASGPTGDFSTAPGIAFQELQFYPPGWVPQFASQSCDPTKWCAALTIDSLAEDPINGTTLNGACQKQILGGIEYVNFAFLTLDGTPIGKPNPLQFDPATSGNPTSTNPKHNDVFFMNQGDQVTVKLFDNGTALETAVTDNTTGQTGKMVASAANGFGQIQYAPGHAKACVKNDYNFRPAYSTSTPDTRVLWAAHSYNIAMDVETGHFDFCSRPNANGSCAGVEGVPGDTEKGDKDDSPCFPASASLLYPTAGCNGTNAPGFDGTSYNHYWPDSSNFPTPLTKPTPFLFSSPLFGNTATTTFGTAYANSAFEADLPRIEAPDVGGFCNRSTGAGCTNPPYTDDNATDPPSFAGTQPVAFYPYFSKANVGTGALCEWGAGENWATGQTSANDFGKVTQFGNLYKLTYWLFGGGGATIHRFNNFNSAAGTGSNDATLTFTGNPC
jgi:hypothetical protein